MWVCNAECDCQSSAPNISSSQMICKCALCLEDARAVRSRIKLHSSPLILSLHSHTHTPNASCDRFSTPPVVTAGTWDVPFSTRRIIKQWGSSSELITLFYQCWGNDFYDVRFWFAVSIESEHLCVTLYKTDNNTHLCSCSKHTSHTHTT